MSQIIEYYRRALDDLELMGEKIKSALPDLADKLAEQSADKECERIVQAVAFLNARTEARLDDDQCILRHSLLQQLLPFLYRPMPCVFLVMFKPEIDAVLHNITKGSYLESSGQQGLDCKYKIGYDSKIYPVCIKEIVSGFQNDSSLEKLSVSLVRLNEDFNFNQIDNLRFYINLGEMSWRLYRYLLINLARVEVKYKDKTVKLNKDVCRCVGLV